LLCYIIEAVKKQLLLLEN